MSYAPHTNADVRDQLRAGITPTLPILLGSFRHMETDVLFEYAKRPNTCEAPSKTFAFAPEMPHLLFMSDGSTRYAKVMHTVAYVVIDEDAEGKPVLGRWPLKSHRVYMLDWVRA